MSLDRVRAQIKASIALKQVLLSNEDFLLNVTSLAEGAIYCLKRGGKIVFAGNGGSFADAQHLSAEFVSRFNFDRAPMASVVLGVNGSAISAIGNDYGYEYVFARELDAIAKSEDMFIPLSTSGKSANILAAARRAKELGLITVALTGAEGGKLKAICDCICVPSIETARIQEAHIMIGHIICELVESKLFQKTPK